MKRTLLLCLAAGLTGCAVNPQTGRHELSPQGEAALTRIGEAAALGALRIAEYQINQALNESVPVDKGK